MSFYMIDTQVLQYLVVGASGSLDPRATGVRDWYRETKEQQHVIGISSLVLGEFLTPHPPIIYTQLIEAFNEDWVVYPYNNAAARAFAELRYEHIKTYDRKLLREIREAQKNGKITRQGLSVDKMILAHAIALEAEAFYSLNHDDFRKLAINRIDVREPMPKQRSLL